MRLPSKKSQAPTALLKVKIKNMKGLDVFQPNYDFMYKTCKMLKTLSCYFPLYRLLGGLGNCIARNASRSRQTAARGRSLLEKDWADVPVVNDALRIHMLLYR